MMRSLCIVLFLLPVMAIRVNAQGGGTGEVRIVGDSRIDTLVEYHIMVNEKKLQDGDNYGIEGYRVQIFFESGNNSSTGAQEVKEEFEERYPGIPAYISWKAPNFRVRVGDFRTRIDASGFLNKIQKKYPNAWVIKDEIKFPSLN